MNIHYDDEEKSFTVKMTGDFLYRANDVSLDQVVKGLRGMMVRKRAEIQCARDGHPQDDVSLERSGVCGRCWLVVDEEKFEKVKRGFE